MLCLLFVFCCQVLRLVDVCVRVMCVYSLCVFVVIMLLLVVDCVCCVCCLLLLFCVGLGC